MKNQRVLIVQAEVEEHQIIDLVLVEWDQSVEDLVLLKIIKQVKESKAKRVLRKIKRVALRRFKIKLINSGQVMAWILTLKAMKRLMIEVLFSKEEIISMISMVAAQMKEELA
jgi:hypothetical protein